ncbi:MAG: putative MFS family arabinose efflux permease [Candidatus Pseudothioglobus sp.]|jgi:predicted MFS family arabinose efflux permease
MLKLPMFRNLGALTLAQVFAQCAPPMVILLGGIVGARLTSNPSLATLPIAFMICGTALSSIPAAMLMSRFGRKRGFIGSAMSATLAGVLAAYAISIEHFWLFCLATLLVGSNNAFVQQYRFAVAESVPAEKVAQSISVLMIAGVFAAWLGPEVAQRLHNWSTWGEFSGSFLGLALLMAIALFWLAFYSDYVPTVSTADAVQRPLPEIISQPMFVLAVGAAAVAYAVMSLVMTATPVSMHTVDHFSLEDTTWVIQSHVMAMYLPSLFSGLLVSRFGPVRIILVGLVLMLGCLMVAFIDRQLMHYWLSLVLLGVGWNFLFLGGTTLLTSTYTTTERFKVQALNDALIFSIQACGALGSGYVLLAFGWQTLLLVCVPMLVVLLLIVWLTHAKPQAHKSTR